MMMMMMIKSRNDNYVIKTLKNQGTTQKVSSFNINGLIKQIKS